MSGRVQGVWFRQSTAEQARAHGLSGWVRNLDDGRVEAWLQGPSEAIEATLAWMRAGGPPAAEVQELQAEDRELDAALAGAFEVRA